MGYIVIIVIAVIVSKVLIKRTFYWETIIKYLWKQVYIKADMMASLYKCSDSVGLDISTGYKKPIMIIGNLINSILDFVNFFDEKDKEDEDYEEETFGYGRFSYEEIFNIVRNNPDSFKNLIGKK